VPIASMPGISLEALTRLQEAVKQLATGLPEVPEPLPVVRCLAHGR
jgi:hypothetical protein